MTVIIMVSITDLITKIITVIITIKITTFIIHSHSMNMDAYALPYFINLTRLRCMTLDYCHVQGNIDELSSGVCVC